MTYKEYLKGDPIPEQWEEQRNVVIKALKKWEKEMLEQIEELEAEKGCTPEIGFFDINLHTAINAKISVLKQKLGQT